MLIPPKLCAWCHEPFTPTKDTQECCNNTCKYKRIGLKLRGRKPEAATRAKAAKDRARATRELQSRFGTLTDRDLELYAAGQRKGYMAGSNKARVTYTSRRGRAA